MSKQRGVEQLPGETLARDGKHLLLRSHLYRLLYCGNYSMPDTHGELVAPLGVSRGKCAWDWLMIFIVFLCTTPGCTTVTYETLNQGIVDAAITSSVKTKILTDPLADLGEINIESVKNRVHLTGVVPTIEDKRRAHEVAIEVPGVISVVNDLHVRVEPNL